jgi:hypothetical protein
MSALRSRPGFRPCRRFFHESAKSLHGRRQSSLVLTLTALKRPQSLRYGRALPKMIVYLATKTRFREDILSNRIEWIVHDSFKKVL